MWADPPHPAVAPLASAAAAIATAVYLCLNRPRLEGLEDFCIIELTPIER
jgi:hypothetical protein